MNYLIPTLLSILAATASVAAPPPCSNSDFPHSAALITTGGEHHPLCLRIAKTAAERQRGLMHLQLLQPNQGMLFLYPSSSHEPFWMKNTPLPLSIAFLDQNRHIQEVLQMGPCSQDPCPHYRAERPYHSALEMESGRFQKLGIKRGAKLLLSDGNNKD